ncbi:hypothetical protein G6F65_018242 [Rhizopus arrhizus]|nr:hypothetical protein G6F65_018242 [Rhizopus arrhizus]
MEYISGLTSPMIDDYATELREASPMADGRLSLPQIRLSRSNSASRTLPFSLLGGSIVYVQSEDGAGERVCREELWRSRKSASWNSETGGLVSREVPLSPPTAVEIDPSARTAAAGLLRTISKDFVLAEARDYLYDDQERLVEIRKHGRGPDGMLFSQTLNCMKWIKATPWCNDICSTMMAGCMPPSDQRRRRHRWGGMSWHRSGVRPGGPALRSTYGRPSGASTDLRPMRWPGWISNWGST